MTATIHKVVAGNGFQYYLRNVAANDATSRGRSSLSDYYSVHGESPGRWHGSGLAALGIDVGAEVTEAQMKSLFGLGRHPNAEVIEAAVYDRQIHLGAKHKDAARAADNASRLGNPFRVYAEVSAFRKRCEQAFREHNTAHGRDPTAAIPDDDRARIRTHVAFDMFTDEYGRAPLDARELSGWIAKNSRPPATAVAGFDITFSPVKSVSALWAIAPREVAEKIEAAHHAAVSDALAWLEQHAIFTRLGRNGVRQVDVEGIVAACFLHRESRSGDPDLHTHVVIANRVRTLDGRWRTLDGAGLYQVVVTVSEIYNTRLEHHLETTVGVEFAARPDTDPTKRPIREILGIPVALIERWSQREAALKARLGELAAEFQARFGREPVPIEMYNLAQRATLETRPAKHSLRSRAEQRGAWRTEAVGLLGGRNALAEVVARALNPSRAARVAVSAAWINSVVQRVLEVVSEQRSTWRHSNIRAEVERQVRGHITPGDWEWVTEAVTTEAFSPTYSIARGDPDLAEQPELRVVPQPLRRRDGASVHTRAGAQLYTTAAILSVEQQLIELSIQPGGRQLSPHTITEAVRDYSSANPDRPLNAGQISVVEGFATSGLRVHTANAPAGSGKTTAMRVLTDAWHASGGKVLGVAPTASAAAVLGRSIGARVETADKVLTIVNLHSPRPDNPALAREVPPPLPQWVLDIDPDTLVIVDEHVKLGNLKRLRLLRFLTGRGATIRCIGDDHQLPAIEAGGADADMAAAAPEHSMTLTHVVRFASTGEATASLGLREGDPAALGWYLDNGRVHAGHHGATHDDTYTAWMADHLAGLDTIMLAPTHEVVTALNERARADRIAREGAGTGAEVVLTDRLCASVGDTIRTRHNDARLRLGAHDWVRNGYAWTVTAVHDDGSLTATHLRSGGETGSSVRLPASYVRTHVRLGYATTIDSAQGITADTCHVALTGYESRQQLYVALTRGVHANHAYVPTALDGSEASFWSEPAVFPRTAVEVLLRILERDGAQKSAHTELRDALDPQRRIGRALDIYLDAIGAAAENALGSHGLDRIDTAADSIHTNLTDSPAYPVLRQHLAIIAMTGRDPLTALQTAAAARELDTADDPAAVLDWRLDPTGAHSTSSGPLPFAHGLPRALADDPLAEQLRARHRIVANLARQITDDTGTWTPVTAPHWARSLLGGDPALVAELAVWRASMHIPQRDLRPTGPTRYAVLERDYQQALDDRLADALGDVHLPVNKWTAVIEELDTRITADPYWPTLADKIELADRAGIDITGLLYEAAARRPLPDEMPAAALWSRLELEPSALDHTLGSRDLRPDWLSDLHSVLGTTTAEHVVADPAWPRIVAAIDRAAGTHWTPHDLLATAHELLLSAQPDHAPSLRPDQLGPALAWRIDALLRHIPARTAPHHPPPRATQPTATRTPSHREPAPETTVDTDHNNSFATEPAPATDPTPPTAPDILPVDLRTLAELLQAGQLADATKFGNLTASMTAEQQAILTAVARTLHRNSFPVARARLQWAAERFPQHATLIHACTPDTDPHLYRPPEGESPQPAYRRDRRHEAARDHREYRDPTRRRAPRPRAEMAGEDLANNYFDLHDKTNTPTPADQPLHDGIWNPYPDETNTPAPDQPLHDGIWNPYDPEPPTSYAFDYELAALPTTRGLPCVTCGIERRRTDATPVPPRRADDGLCGPCRDNGETGIPDHDPTQHIQARCAHFTATKPPDAARAVLRRDWRATPNPHHRSVIETWVREHLTKNTTADPTQTSPVDQATDNPLILLTDEQLARAIDHLELRLALTDTETAFFNPPTHPPDTPDPDELARHHRAAQDAIRQAHQTDQQLNDAVHAAHTAAVELDQARSAFDATPSYRRNQRRQLQTQISELLAKHNTLEHKRDTARTAARRARREAVMLAGPESGWEHLLTSQPEPPTPTPPHASNDAAKEQRTRISGINDELDELQAEQRRRRTLTPDQREIETQLRAMAPTFDAYPESSEAIGELHESYRDDSLGL
ncbi:MobF family relaxase [Nocardia xishanensis]|uniref:MobF family relaxase n=1 Tax=Nocardia xishanensis TaxID=238964 RepID=UPI000AD48C87|nr:MobF family relaxase [Nocardia xishanensis]